MDQIEQTHVGDVLVVDDNPTNLKVLLNVLESEKLRVKIAKSGEDALKKLQRSLPDVILLDIQMPGGIDGFETCRQIKANPTTESIPVIFMTALHELENKVQGLKLGAVDYITKPFQQEEVVARIDVHLRLRKAQLQLLQASRQAAVGQLAAGIAHEINNPVNFIYGNLQHTQDYIEYLFKVIESYENIDGQVPEAQLEHKVDGDELSLEFIRQDVPQMLQSMLNGTQRIRSLVLSLQNFSRLNESEWKMTQVSEGIESSLVLLSDRLRPQTSTIPEIQVIKNYASIPLVSGYPALLNEAIMHLMLNAIDALEAKLIQPEAIASSFQPQLTLTTQLSSDEQSVLITVQDNGVGIPLSVQTQMFDQFYTTKGQGQGIGLGLPICQQIVEQKHQGKLTYHSEPGVGSQFTIQLPCGK
ncbi:MAG: hybrid sensor histidine kinase/response regulator [Spirulina sp. SIO3F2]|nr:hybrid sensor histidine kinase/response regulator [Spirulina sp. SIO3F2]